MPFARELYIERDDFMEEPAPKFFRLAPGREVRLRYAYLITCREVEKDAAGEVVLLRCSYDPATRGGDAPDGRKVKGTLHWVSAAHAVPAEVRLYDHLFTQAEPGADGDFLADLNPRSLEVLSDCRLEPSLATAAGEPVQFERQGYFCRDPDSTPRAAGVQPHRRAPRHLGQDPDQRRVTAEGCAYTDPAKISTFAERARQPGRAVQARKVRTCCAWYWSVAAELIDPAKPPPLWGRHERSEEQVMPARFQTGSACSRPPRRRASGS